jgi:hypothetical protein
MAALRGNENILEKILAWAKEKRMVMDDIIITRFEWSNTLALGY